MKHPERNFRKDHYWHIHNFSASEKLPRSTFSHAVSRLKKTGGLGKEVHYQIADKFASGREGHCFGMSVAAVKEWHESGKSEAARKSEVARESEELKSALSSRRAEATKGPEEVRFTEIKSKAEATKGLGKSGTVSGVVKLTPELREEILALHLKQLEPDYLGYVVRLFAKRLLFASHWSMKLIAELIDREGCVLVNVVDVKKLAGHTVVAYDYHKDPKTGEYIIYVADSNHPWSEAEEGRHPSCIRLVDSADGKKVAGLYYRNRCDGRYEVVFGVPYKYIR